MVAFSTDEYQLSKLSDLSDLSKEKRIVDSFEFSVGDWVKLVVRIGKTGASFSFPFSDEKDLERLGAATQIREFLLSKRKNWRAFLMDHAQKLNYLWMIYSFSFMLIALLGSPLPESRNYYWFIWGALGLASFLVNGYVFIYVLKNNTKLFVVSKQETPSFLERNLDRILVGAISVIVTYLLTKFL